MLFVPRAHRGAPVPSLFKSGPELFEQALDLSRRREFSRAKEKFHDASKKLASEGNVAAANLASAYAYLMGVALVPTDARGLAQLATFLRTYLGETELRPGPRGILASDLASQLDIEATELTLEAALRAGGGDPRGLSQMMQALANQYRSLAGAVLFVPEFTRQTAIDGGTRAPIWMALSFEVLGGAVQAADPLAAAEHFQTAHHYWVQAGQLSRAQGAMDTVNRLALRAKCWYCGREGTGHGIQFVMMPTDQDVRGLKGGDGSPLPSNDPPGRNLFVCKGCNSAMRLAADQLAFQRAREVEARLLPRILALEAALRAQR